MNIHVISPMSRTQVLFTPSLPFTASAEKVLGLKDARTRLQTVYFLLLWYLLSVVCVSMKILSCASAKKKTETITGFKLCTVIGRFQVTSYSEGVKDEYWMYNTHLCWCDGLQCCGRQALERCPCTSLCAISSSAVEHRPWKAVHNCLCHEPSAIEHWPCKAVHLSPCSERIKHYETQGLCPPLPALCKLQEVLHRWRVKNKS